MNRLFLLGSYGSRDSAQGYLGDSALARSHPETAIAVEMNGWLHSHVQEHPWHRVNRYCRQ